jgi:hypothetical protein
MNYIVLFLLVLISVDGHASNYKLPGQDNKSHGCDLKVHFVNAPTKDEFKKIYHDFTKAINERNWDLVSDKFLTFPFTVRKQEKEWIINSRLEFKKDADKLFGSLTPLKDFESTVFFCNYQGLMIQNGHLWLNIDDKQSISIKSINHK